MLNCPMTLPPLGSRTPFNGDGEEAWYEIKMIFTQVLIVYNRDGG